MSAYVDFCAAHGMNPYHPRTWTPEQETSYAAWKLENYKEKWAFFREQKIAEWMPREVLKERVRHSVQALRAPAPSRPFTVCPCCPPYWQRMATTPVVHGLRYIRSFRP